MSELEIKRFIQLLRKWEKVKAERDGLKIKLSALDSDAATTILSLRTELSAKDKVLEWYANEGNYHESISSAYGVTVDKGKYARSILSRYRGEAK